MRCAYDDWTRSASVEPVSDSMTEPIPVNPDILRWARESLGMSLEEVGRRMKKSVEIVESWESGERAPTYVQLERLAYDLYKRPVALFFLPDAPEEEPPERSLRAMPGESIRMLPPRMRWLIRKMTARQRYVAELRATPDALRRRIVTDLDFSTPSFREVEMARQAREYLGVDLSDQRSWRGADEAFGQWRQALEEVGVSVFKDSFSAPGSGRDDADSGFSGFCLYDDIHPVICVNNNDTKSRQVFTLFHELGHLLMRTGAVDMRTTRYSDALGGGDPAIEARCNRFTAEFLVPADDLAARSHRRAADDEAVTAWANEYGVSRETILRRLLDAGRVSAAEYERRARRVSGYRRRPSGGGDFYRTKGAYLGERYVEAVFREHYRGRLSVREAADYLDVSVRQVAGMEMWLFAREGRNHDDLRI